MRRHEEQRDIVVASPYPEGAIVALAASLSRQRLRVLYTSAFNILPGFVGKIPLHAVQHVDSRLHRRRWAGLSSDLVEDVAVAPELLRMACANSPLDRRWCFAAMYLQKRAFDSAVARRLQPRMYRLFVGVQGSAAVSLRRARDSGCVGVLHHVNSCASEHNSLLRRWHRLSPGHRELLPDGVVRVEAEELNQASIILVPSQFIARQLVARAVPATHISVQPYGVDVERFQPRDAPLVNSTTMRLLYVGEISLRKGIPFLIEAALRLPSIALTLIGPVVSPELLRKLPSNVHYAGNRPSPQIPASIQSADALVLPSLEDSYGLVVLEAMASGLPVIVSSHAGASEIIESGREGIIVPPGDVTALVRAIEWLADEPTARVDMGSRGRTMVADRYTWGHYCDRVINLLNRRMSIGAC